MISNHADTQLFFFELIKRAQLHLPHNISENAESYIVFMLSGAVSDRRFFSTPLFTILEQALEMNKPDSFKELKKLGDYSLLTLGLFPDAVSRRNVSDDYFRNMGQMGYNRAGDLAERLFDRDFGDLYRELADSFRAIESIIRKARGLAPLNVVWNSSEDM